jgi:peptidoglycan hydrolase CwlO-like protein
MMLTVREFVRRNEDKLLAEIEDLKVTISESEVKHRLAESELVVKMAGELTELQSQVDDLQEELGETRAQSNLKDWEIRFLKEDVKRLTAKLYEKRHFLQTRDTED